MSNQRYRPSVQRQTERQRGERAWNNIAEVCQQSDEVKKKYRTQARQFATLVRTNSLAQTVAFFYAKAKPKTSESDPSEMKAEAQANRLLLAHLDAALLQHTDESFTPDRLIRYLLNSSSQANREATVAALAFARWLSRFAEAELPSDEDTRATAPVQQEA